MQNICPFFVCGVACFLSQTTKTSAGTAEFDQLGLKSCSKKNELQNCSCCRIFGMLLCPKSEPWLSKLEGPSLAGCSWKLFAGFSFIAGCSAVYWFCSWGHSWSCVTWREVFSETVVSSDKESLQVLGLILCLVEKYPYHLPATFILDFLSIFGLSLGPSLLSPIH